MKFITLSQMLTHSKSSFWIRWFLHTYTVTSSSMILWMKSDRHAVLVWTHLPFYFNRCWHSAFRQWKHLYLGRPGSHRPAIPRDLNLLKLSPCSVKESYLICSQSWSCTSSCTQTKIHMVNLRIWKDYTYSSDQGRHFGAFLTAILY